MLEVTSNVSRRIVSDLLTMHLNDLEIYKEESCLLRRLYYISSRYWKTSAPDRPGFDKPVRALSSVRGVEVLIILYDDILCLRTYPYYKKTDYSTGLHTAYYIIHY